ncbi:MAG TPA: M14 family zinc carboxypeptidase, partial [Arenibacter sp.]|nr:M14 family zinc carboxypeptidase [Arenibacter sp.]
TTTKSVLDLVNYLRSGSDLAKSILKNCRIAIIPMLNPDGADAYTRVNANAIDLNRDAQDRTQPESIILNSLYHNFRPDYCFNLHDQRTIYNVGDTPKPATVSFLAPARDPERSISEARAISMQLIVAMNRELQKYIPGQIGRYDDGFNANCVGDAFQMLHTPTILFEAGHFQGDYERERTRFYIFAALLKGLAIIARKEVDTFAQAQYFDIPGNNKLFYDILVKNIDRLDPSRARGESAGILFVETLVQGKIDFVGKLEQVGDLDHMFGHKTYNCLDPKDLGFLKNNLNLLNALK